MRKSLEARIYAFKTVHGNRYDYSRFTDESPIVICRIHGPFKVSIANHMKGKGHCRDCSKITRLRKRRRELIPKLEGWLPEGHSLTWLSEDLQKFTMECKNGSTTRRACAPRGEFFICTDCRGRQRGPKRPSMSLKARWSKYAPKSLVLRSINGNKITCYCKIHDDEFEVWQTNVRVGFSGCRKCSAEKKRSTAKKDLLRKFAKAHGDRYDYSQVDYQGADKKVTIICREHGPWETLPGNHYQGSGCWKCFSGASSKPERDWMKAIGAKLRQKQSATARVKGRRGGVCEADATFKNVVIEFDGAYWHSLPEAKEKDEYKNRLLTEAGYHMIRLRNSLPPVDGAHCFTVPEDPDESIVREVAKLVLELQGLSVRDMIST